jgi:hypothetical protein
VTRLPGVARQCAKHREWLRRERYGLPGARQPRLSLIKLETVEAQPREGCDPLSCEGSFQCSIG